MVIMSRFMIFDVQHRCLWFCLKKKLKRDSNIYAKRKESIKYFNIHPIYLLSPWINQPTFNHRTLHAQSKEFTKEKLREGETLGEPLIIDFLNYTSISFACSRCTAIRKALLLLLQLLRLPEDDAIKGQDENNKGKGKFLFYLCKLKK